MRGNQPCQVKGNARMLSKSSPVFSLIFLTFALGGAAGAQTTPETAPQTLPAAPQPATTPLPVRQQPGSH